MGQSDQILLIGQTDQIGLFLKGHETNVLTNAVHILGYFLTSIYLKFVVPTFNKNLATLYSNIWSHCVKKNGPFTASFSFIFVFSIHS